MQSLLLTLLIGVLAGFFGAIPPGPLNVSILRKTLDGHRQGAFRVAIGGAAIDALICGVIGLGLGWALATIATNRWVRGFLALFLLAYGLKILLWDLRREEEAERLAARANNDALGETPAPWRGTSRFPFVTGILQGAANPALVVNWTLLVGFLVGHRLFVPNPLSAGVFALGASASSAWMGSGLSGTPLCGPEAEGSATAGGASGSRVKWLMPNQMPPTTTSRPAASAPYVIR